jgi:hypothetical protein
LIGNATGCNKVYKERKRKMSDRTMTCENEFLYADEYLVSPATCCHGVNQADAKSLTFDVPPEITFELAPNQVDKEKKGNIYTKMMDFLALIRDVLLPRPQDGTDYRPNCYGSSPGVIYKSYGGTIQPMIWSHGDQHGKRDQWV